MSGGGKMYGKGLYTCYEFNPKIARTYGDVILRFEVDLTNCGSKVLKPMKSSDPKVFDYANSKMRSEFMDIYLGAKCTFCVSLGGAGFFGIPFVFPKPLCATSTNTYAP